MAKILIIEDSVDVREMVILVLKSFGYDVVSTTYKDTLTSQISSFNPNLILLDVNPGDSGTEMCQQIKKTNASLPIILMSTHNTLLVDYKSCQAMDTIEKPFPIMELKNKIEKALSKKVITQKTEKYLF